MEEYFKVGIITATHGLGGEVKVFPTTDDVRRFSRLKEVIYLKASSGASEGRTAETEESGPDASSPVLTVENVKYLKQFAVLKFQGVDSVEDARRYCRGALFVPRDKAVRLKKDEYFIADLIGLAVRDEDGAEIGCLKDVLETGANDVYEVTMPDGEIVLFPAIRDCIREVDIDAGYMKVHVMEGLLDAACSGKKS